MLLKLHIGLSAWWSDIRTRALEEGGASAIEYGLMLALIAAVIVVAVTLLGQATSEPFEDVATRGLP